MYAYDPILLQKIEINEWINESPNNILVLLEYKNNNDIRSFSQFNSKKYNIFALNKDYLQNINIRDIFFKCILVNDQLLPNETYKSKSQFYNLGFYLNRNILIDIDDLKPSKLKGQFFNLVLSNNVDDYINKEYLLLSNIGIAPSQKMKLKDLNKLSKSEQERIKKDEMRNKIIDNKNLPYKKEVYFENILAKALTNYSFQWDAPINTYLRTGLSYFDSPIFKKYYLRYGKTLKEAKNAVLNKIMDLDRAFLEAAPRNENANQVYWRGMKQNFTGLQNTGDRVVVPNFMSITTNYNIAVSFSDIRNVNKCCLYKIYIDKGIPFIDMVTTTKYKHEKEILLPRGLIFKLVGTETIKFPIYNKPNNTIDIMIINVHMNNPLTFKIKTNCKSYNLAKLEQIKKPTFLQNSIDITKTKPKAKIEKNKENIKQDDKQDNDNKSKENIKRCPKGTRKNKKTGLCETIILKPDVLKQKSKGETVKEKLPNCPKGTRRNKKSGLCEPHFK